MTRYFLAILMLAFISCKNKAEAQNLNMPKDDESEKPINYDINTYSFLILGDSIYAYQDTVMKNYKKISIADGSLRKYVSSLVGGQHADKLVFVITPTMTASYKNIVDVLDEIAISKVQKYSINKLTKREEDFFGLKKFENGDYGVKASSVEVKPFSLAENKPYLLLRLKADEYLSFQYADEKNNSPETRINPPTAEKIYDELNKIEKQYSIDLHKVNILVKGDNDVKFKPFEQVIEGLKMKNLLKYNLITEELTN